jgi:hypothetical protein
MKGTNRIDNIPSKERTKAIIATTENGLLSSMISDRSVIETFDISMVSAREN